MNRRHFLAAALAIAGCQRQRASLELPHAARELRVFCHGAYSKAMREAFVPAFETQTGATISLHTGSDAIAKVKAADAVSFDLVLTDAAQGLPAAKEGLFATLKLDNIPNHKRIAPTVLQSPIFRERHGVPFPDAAMTLLFNRRDKAFSRRTPKSWSDLLMKDLAGKLGLHESYFMSLWTFACIEADLDGKPGTAHTLLEKNLDGVFAFAKTYRDRVKLWWPTPTSMIQSLAGSELGAGNMHSTECATALREYLNLHAIVPEHDRACVQLFWGVPEGSKNQDLAEEAINFFFSDDVQLAFTRRGLTTPIPSVAEKAAKQDAQWKLFNPHTEVHFAKLRYYPYEFYAANRSDIAEMWERTILRTG